VQLERHDLGHALAFLELNPSCSFRDLLENLRTHLFVVGKLVLSLVLRESLKMQQRVLRSMVAESFGLKQGLFFGLLEFWLKLRRKESL